jgi:HAD superfamily hydrolase (TIGR01509 family)
MTEDRILAWTPSAIVFDCDGTLMDTERHWQEARALVLRAHGSEPDADFAARAKGLHYTECGRLMAESVGRPELAEEMTVQLLDEFRHLVADNPVTAPGAAELVRQVSKFARLAVASNCPRDVVETCLGTADLLRYFEHVVVPGEGMLPKPYPDVYLSATLRCGSSPSDSLAVEDSGCGIQSANRAGLRVIGVGPRPEGKVQVDMWVRSLGEPHLVAWAESRVPRQRSTLSGRAVVQSRYGREAAG